MKHALPEILLAISPLYAGNPIITDVFTADPAPLVVGDTVYLYCGQDEAGEKFYHNGSIQHPNTGGSFCRSVCIVVLEYHPDGTIQRIFQTSEGLDLPRGK